jgi:uncharacterized membrane protein
MAEPVSQRLALGGLVALILGLAAPPVSAWATLAAAPLVLLLLTGLRPPRRWGAWTALSMIPYFTWWVAEMLTEPRNPWRSASLAVLTIAVFLAGFDALRRKRVTLR